jgi:ribonuclease P/MRP protein subunit RPP1
VKIILFFDFHVKDDPELVKEADRLGYAGLALFSNGNGNNSSGNGNKVEVASGETINPENSTKKENPIKTYKGVFISARNPESMRQKVKKSRKNADVIMVRGGDQKINRAACEDPQVDILSAPYLKRRDCGINHVMAKKAALNEVAVELNIKYLTKTNSYLHYKVLSHFREIIKLKRKYGFPLIITSDAESIYGLHTPQDLIALSGCFGMDREEAEAALSKTPQKIIERSETRDKVVVDGVKIIE